MSRSILIVQGAAWGSEAKGAAALFLCQKEKVKWAVRTGSINAGHTIHHAGKRLVFQQLPVAAVLPDVRLVLGPGAYVHPEVLQKELAMSGAWGRLTVDGQCGIHLDSYTDEAKAAARNIRIGATGKGCAEAIIHKIKDRGLSHQPPLLFRDRRSDDVLISRGEWPLASVPLDDTAGLLTSAYDAGEKVLIEGTQGSLLDLHTGPYPFVTSRQTIASAWVAECGLSPALDYEVVLVARTFPIRVAGNSGPMGQDESGNSLEIDWPTLAREMNARLLKHSLPAIVPESALAAYEEALASVSAKMKQELMHPNGVSLWAPSEALSLLSEGDLAAVSRLFEKTTVTRRLRRIARLDEDLLARTVRKERPAYLILSFLNYKFPEIAYTRRLHDEALDYIGRLEKRISCKVRYVSIGPKSEDFIELKG